MRVHSTAPEGEGMEGPDGDGVEIKTNKLEIRGGGNKQIWKDAEPEDW